MGTEAPHAPTLTLPKPHPAQQSVMDEAKLFNVVCCGRRWGKTELGKDRLIHAAPEGKPVAWFAANFGMALSSAVKYFS